MGKAFKNIDDARHLNNIPTKWSTAFPNITTTINTDPHVLAFYWRKSHYYGNPVHVNDLYARRNRSLFPQNWSEKRALKCIFRTSLHWDAHHIMFDCTHHSHTTTIADLRTALAPHGTGWWTPNCPQDGLCHARTMLWGCLHQIRCFVPKYDNDPNFKVLQIWLQYIHARLIVCYPRNYQIEHY
jgi:hypothetical protein